MKNRLLLILLLISIIGISYSQEYIGNLIPPELIITSDDGIEIGGERSGSCASPDGPILCPALTAYPTVAWLQANGYCYTLASPTKDATFCWTFTSPGTTIELNSAFFVNICGSYSYYFDNFKLYTCAPACALFGTGLIFTGMTAGQCYTWCFHVHFTGCGATGGFTGFCPYFIYVIPLPIELGNFYCIYENNAMQLNWETLSEMNCDKFEILRCTNGLDFEQIGSVNGNGNSSQKISYSFTDNAPLETNYYKLKEIDFDGGFTFSDVITGSYSDVVLEVIYYNLLGERIDYEKEKTGIFIKEIVTSSSRNRVVIYKTQ